MAGPATAPRTSTAEHTRRLGVVLTPRRDTAAAFAAAARHTRRVRILKIAVPVIAVAALLLPIVVSAILSFTISVPLGDFGRLVLSGSRLTMEAPRLAGYTKDNRGYEVSAKAAQQDMTRPNHIELEDIKAKVGLSEKGWAQLVAARGAFDTQTEMLTLYEGIEIKTDQGHSGRLREAKVDVRAGTITSSQPVEIDFLDGILRAQTMEVRDNGQILRFDGAVTMTVKLPQSPGTAKPGGQK